jgi:hypothetical protein
MFCRHWLCWGANECEQPWTTLSMDGPKQMNEGVYEHEWAWTTLNNPERGQPWTDEWGWCVQMMGTRTAAVREEATELQLQWQLEGAHMQGGNGSSGGGRVCTGAGMRAGQEWGLGSTNEGRGAQTGSGWAQTGAVECKRGPHQLTCVLTFVGPFGA